MRQQANAQTDQHYVPQLLLRGFASASRRQLYVCDKRTGKVFRSSVRNLACERAFYQLKQGSDPNRIDRWLGKLEEVTAPIIQPLRARKTLNHLETSERQWLAAFIAVQHVRTRHHRELSADINQQIADTIREMGTEPNSVGNFRELTDAEIHEFTISDVPRLAFTLVPHILDKSWVLLAAAPGTEFWIGDHPVVLANNMNPGDGITGTSGFAVRGIEIYLPISGELTLGCLCPTIPTMFAAANWRLRQFALPALARNDEFLKAFTGSATLQLDAENVKYHNSLQAIRAERFVFCQHQNFDLLQEMLTTDPTLRTGPRVRNSRQIKTGKCDMMRGSRQTGDTFCQRQGWFLSWLAGRATDRLSLYSGRSFFFIAPEMRCLDVIWVVIPPLSSHPFRIPVVWHNVRVIRELYMADSAFPVLVDNLPVQQFPHFSG